MVNYLWPSLTIAVAILFNGQKAHWWAIPGLLPSLFGVCWVVGGLNLAELKHNLTASPQS